MDESGVTGYVDDDLVTAPKAFYGRGSQLQNAPTIPPGPVIPPPPQIPPGPVIPPPSPVTPAGYDPLYDNRMSTPADAQPARISPRHFIGALGYVPLTVEDIMKR
jgi:hypothetical protein